MQTNSYIAFAKFTGTDETSVTFHKSSPVYSFLHYVVRLKRRRKKRPSELMTVLRPLMCTSDPSPGVSEAVHLITEILSSAPAQTQPFIHSPAGRMFKSKVCLCPNTTMVRLHLRNGVDTAA